MTPSNPRPTFAQLPLDPSHPPHSAWGLYGPDDELGTLNLLTPERTAEAAKEIRTGTRVGLNWPLEQMSHPGFAREPLTHEIFTIAENMNDDRLALNTQTSSQWDGLRHWGFPSGHFYNGLTQAEIHSGTTSRLGIHAWARQGIVGRGVLIDYLAYARAHHIPYDPLTHHAIPLSTLLAIAAEKNIVFRPGDILLLRTGFTAAYAALPEDARPAVMQAPLALPGLAGGRDVLAWLWDAGIAAVAGDNPGFEAWPPGEGEGLHRGLLAGFGMPIGELFDLEALGRVCEREGRWTFFFVSVVLNVRGGVGSPPNAVAVF